MNVRAVVLAGIAWTLAMVPPSIVLAAGHQAKRDGDLLAAQLPGSIHFGVLLALHLAIGLVSAVPLGAFVTVARPGMPALAAAGGAYGAGYWLAVNAMALPLPYGRPHRWAEGLGDVWPSLLVHIVYGTISAAVLGVAAGIGQHSAAGAARHRCGLCPLLRAIRTRRGVVPFVAPTEGRHRARHAAWLRRHLASSIRRAKVSGIPQAHAAAPRPPLRELS